MGFFSKFENKMEDAVDDFGDKFFDSPISPVQIAKKAEKQMRRNKMLGAGKQYAPTLYTVLVNTNDDQRLKGYYPTLAGETETYLKAKANEYGLSMDGDPLVRFMDYPDLKSGKFDVIAEAVAGDIIEQLRNEEMQRYGINKQAQAAQAQLNMNYNQPAQQIPQQQPQQNYGAEVPSAAPSSPFADFDQPAQQMPSQAPQQVPSQPVAQMQNQVARTYEQNVQQVPQQVPVPEPQVAPQPTPVPQASPAAQVNVDNQVPVNNQSDVPLSSSPTAVFAGGFDVSANQPAGQNQGIPPASLIDNASGRRYSLNSATTVIGRENSCNVCLPDVNASRQHAQITYNNGLWLVNDLGSTNGTFVNNQEITTREIHPGDVITVGVTHLIFNLG